MYLSRSEVMKKQINSIIDVINSSSIPEIQSIIIDYLYLFVQPNQVILSHNCIPVVVSHVNKKLGQARIQQWNTSNTCQIYTVEWPLSEEFRPILPGMCQTKTIQIGKELMVQDTVGCWHLSTIIEILPGEKVKEEKVLIRYNTRSILDEWIDINSKRVHFQPDIFLDLHHF